MLTYVINTSENKTFDSNLLFELVGYRQIQWKHCSLSRISECAEEIFKEVDALSVAEADKYRVVVLVDFYGFPSCKKAEDEAAADIVNIYKKCIRQYLTHNLYDYLSSRNVAPTDYVIYNIQYVNNRSQKTAMERALAARLFLAAKEKGDTELLPLTEEVEKLPPLCREGTSLEKTVLLDGAPTYSAFYLSCGKDNCLKLAEYDSPLTFEAFYHRYTEYIAANCADRVETAPYVTFSTSDEHAAYDVLCMSLFLVWRYECLNDEGRDATAIETARPNPKRLQDVLLSAFGNIHQAQETSLRNACLYYSLEQATAQVRAPKDNEGEDMMMQREMKDGSEKVLSFDEQYTRICQYATKEEGADIPDEARAAIDKAMANYLAARDEKRDVSETEEDLKRSGLFVANSTSCPSELEKKQLLDKQRLRMKELLNDALGAGYTAGDFSKEREKATDIYNDYKRTQALMKRSFLGDLVLLVVTLLVMLVPYGALQLYRAPFSIPSLICYGIAAAIFGGILIFSLLLHVIPIVRKLDRLKRKMQNLYEECCAKNRKALQPLFSRYKSKLLTIEDIRYSIRRIERLDSINRRKNARAEEHRELLESLENTISGILSSMHIITSFSTTPTEIDFDIEKDVADNSIYHVFSAKNIETLFERGGND
ncbi:MAG: hypothetical protein IJY71_07690 [Clostridia bacterium]|nr:hypothetical protein [Clostridia bacterium]